ncbi:MAG: hypothetical protein AAF413_00440 [Patescibacteria group bacterium]
MLFHWFIAFLPPLLILGLPRLVTKLSGKKSPGIGLLVAASAVFAISWFLPSPTIEGVDTSFTTHIVGGGLFSGFVWLYLLKHLRLDINLVSLLYLFGIVSALGAANELLELFLVEVFDYRINTHETNWDILANTIGAVVFTIVLGVTRAVRSRVRSN